MGRRGLGVADVRHGCSRPYVWKAPLPQIYRAMPATSIPSAAEVVAEGRHARVVSAAGRWVGPHRSGVWCVAQSGGTKGETLSFGYYLARWEHCVGDKEQDRAAARVVTCGRERGWPGGWWMRAGCSAAGPAKASKPSKAARMLQR